MSCLPSVANCTPALALLTIHAAAAAAVPQTTTTTPNHTRWEPMLGVLAVGLLPQLRNEQVGYLCHLVRVLHSTQDYLALVALLLQVRRRG